MESFERTEWWNEQGTKRNKRRDFQEANDAFRRAGIFEKNEASLTALVTHYNPKHELQYRYYIQQNQVF
jgi:hypothetical protein